MADPPPNELLNFVESGTEGIVCVDNGSPPHFITFGMPPQTRTLPPFPGLRSPGLNVCSSASGLVLFLDTSSFYWICNPHIFLEDHQDGYRKIAKRTHEALPDHNTAAVLSLDLSDPAHQIFYISCPIDTGGSIYRFDTYTSEFGWRLSNEIPLPKPIAAHTASSCGTTAYWLTTDGDLVAYDPVTRTARPPVHYPQWDNVLSSQLGVVEGNRLGIVTFCEGVVQLNRLSVDGSAWEEEPVGVLDFTVCDESDDESVRADESGMINIRSGGLSCECQPQPLRFESSRLMQVPIVIDEKLYMWEDAYGLFHPGEVDVLIPIVEPEVSIDCLARSVPVTRSDMQI